MRNVMKRIGIIGSSTWVALAPCPFAAAADLPVSYPVKAPRLARRMLRHATLLHRISHNGLRTVLSGTLLLERFGALPALGRRRKDQEIKSEHTD
jgi:hypothetical protein